MLLKERRLAGGLTSSLGWYAGHFPQPGGRYLKGSVATRIRIATYPPHKERVSQTVRRKMKQASGFPSPSARPTFSAPWRGGRRKQESTFFFFSAVKLLNDASPRLASTNEGFCTHLTYLHLVETFIHEVFYLISMSRVCKTLAKHSWLHCVQLSLQRMRHASKSREADRAAHTDDFGGLAAARRPMLVSDSKHNLVAGERADCD